MRKFIWIGILAGTACWVRPVSSPAADLPFLKVFDPSSDSRENWKTEEESASVRFSLFRGVGTLTVDKAPRPWASLMKTFTVDLSRHSLLQVSVLQTTKSWYLILSGPQISNGFLRLIETNQTGNFSFDLGKMLPLKGVQTLEVKIGVSNPEGTVLAGEKVSFDKLAFVSRMGAVRTAPRVPEKSSVEAEEPDSRDALFIFPSGGRDLDAWNESPQEGPQEVRFSVDSGAGIVKGDLSQKNFGALRRQLEIDLEKFTTLEANILSSSKSWFLVLTNPKLKDGYIRLIETDKPGKYQFDIPKLTGLSSNQNFEIQVGVSDPGGTSIRGETVVFDRIRFIP